MQPNVDRSQLITGLHSVCGFKLSYHSALCGPTGPLQCRCETRLSPKHLRKSRRKALRMGFPDVPFHLLLLDALQGQPCGRASSTSRLPPKGDSRPPSHRGTNKSPHLTTGLPRSGGQQEQKGHDDLGRWLICWHCSWVLGGQQILSSLQTIPSALSTLGSMTP